MAKVYLTLEPRSFISQFWEVLTLTRTAGHEKKVLFVIHAANWNEKSSTGTMCGGMKYYKYLHN